MKKLKIAFFGTSSFSVTLLNELISRHHIVPSLVVTTADKPTGRKQILTPSPVKEFTTAHNIPILQPEKLKDEIFMKELGTDWDMFIVASYGKIIPQTIID